MSKQKILFYDIETLPLMLRVWRLGEQVVRHDQLLPFRDAIQLICIQYCFNNGPVHIIKRDLDDITSQAHMIEEFDNLIKQADVVIGKNSDRFDNKHINTIRMLEDLTPMPDWTRYTDDLEKQLRKYFNLPSNSLDYISYKLGLGGKNPMRFSDWIDIDNYFLLLEFTDTTAKINVPSVNRFCEMITGKQTIDVIADGEKALNKMYKYGAKDTKDTVKVWNYCSKHFEPRYSSFKGGDHVCLKCGSDDIIPDRERANGIVTFYCKEHKGYAGRARTKKTGGYGKLI